MKLKLAILLVMLVLLAGCATLEESVPPGDYNVIPADNQVVTPATAEFQGRVFLLQNKPTAVPPYPTYTPPPALPTYTPYPTYTPGTVLEPTATSEGGITPLPTEPPVMKLCQLNVQGVRHALRKDHTLTATVIGNAEIGSHPVGHSFWYSASNVEWVYATASDANTGIPVTGWMRVDSNLLYDPDGPCMDAPSEFENPLPPTSQPQPTYTPAPTSTPTPPAGECWLTAVGTTNLRDKPNGVVIGQAPVGTRTMAVSQYKLSPFTWVKIWWPQKSRYLWTALEVWTSTGNCGGLPVESPFEQPLPTSPVRSGFHVIGGGADSGAVSSYYGRMTTLKCLDWAYQYCLEAKRQNPSIIIVARALITDNGMIDGPNTMEYDNPDVWWARIKNHLPDGYDFYEVQNEWGPPEPDNYRKWANWSIRMAQLVERDKGAAMLAFSFATGNPDYRFWPELLPYMEWVAAHGPAPNGHYHGIALHQTAFATWSRADSPWVNNEHLSGRHRLVRNYLLANTGFDFATWPGVIYMTEMGLNDGYSGNWDAVYSCAELANAYKETIRQYAADGWIDGFHWWNWDKVGKWTANSACASAMLQ